MPAKPRWLLEIPAILKHLRALEMPVVDRSVCEELFRVRRRRTIDLMRQFGGYRSGNTILVDRLDLITTLEALQAAPHVVREMQRKQRLSDHLHTIHQHRAAARVRIEVHPGVQGLRLQDLADGIHLDRGRLTIEFVGAEQLLSKLYELSQAAANDFDQFCAAANHGVR